MASGFIFPHHSYDKYKLCNALPVGFKKKSEQKTKKKSKTKEEEEEGNEGKEESPQQFEKNDREEIKGGRIGSIHNRERGRERRKGRKRMEEGSEGSPPQFEKETTGRKEQEEGKEASTTVKEEGHRTWSSYYTLLENFLNITFLQQCKDTQAFM